MVSRETQMINDMERQRATREFPGIFDESESMHLKVEYSDFERWIPEDGVQIEAFGAFPIARLFGIKQLSFLSYVGPDAKSSYFFPHTHTRMAHSLNVSELSGEIGRQNGLDFNHVNRLRIKGLIHDIATPAHGDATKNVDRKNLDEETHWRDVVGEEGFEFLKKYGVSPESVDDTLLNKGMDGQILDVADRITYVMHDTFNLLSYGDKQVSLDPYLFNLRYLSSTKDNLGNIYQDVRVNPKSGEVVFGDTEKLGIFLLLRAHLHQSMYLYPTNQARDMFIADLIKPFYSTDGSRELSPQVLRKINDEQLMDFLYDKYKPDENHSSIFSFFDDLVNWYPEYEKFDSNARAQQRAEELQDKEIVLGVKEIRRFNTGTNYNVIDGRQIVPFKEAAEPRMVKEIDMLSEENRGFYVFYTHPEEYPLIADLVTASHQLQPANI